MNKTQKQNLFSGPTKSQYIQFERKQKIEFEYINFLKKNPKLTISQYTFEYKKIKNKSLKQINNL